MSRPSRCIVDLLALRNNYRLGRKIHGGKALAVIKSNAYGHGAVRCAQALEGIADGFAVAFLEEALELRASGVKLPILLLEGVFTIDELKEVQTHRLWTVVHHEAQLEMIERSPDIWDIQVWLKGNSGMNRVGFPLVDMPKAHARLRACAKVSEIVFMTHFARADEPDKAQTALQVSAFDQATYGLSGKRSLCNSAGILGWPSARRDWARCGILLYGADPISSEPMTRNFSPVMSLQSQVFAVQMLKPGASVGYGGSFVAPDHMRIGLVAIGYADGYPRSAPCGTPVAIDGKLSRIVGRVSMDMLTVDLSNMPDAGMGSTVELWGSKVKINDVACRAGTISYELLCNVKRVPRLYLDEAAPHLLA